MGGMSALIPIKHDPEANERAIAGVRADKEREAGDGHDGTWVAHPGLVPVAKEVFDRLMPQQNQLDRELDDLNITAVDLLEVPKGSITVAGLRQNVAVALGYVESWLRGIGCVPLFNLMEDAATAEISRAQLWQWVHHKAILEDGTPITAETVDATIDAELNRTLTSVDHSRSDSFRRAADLTRELVRAPVFPEFLTKIAYSQIVAQGL
jgi:malate synthase